jgi:hypothetical protein
MFNIIDLATGWKIDLIMRRSRAFSQTEFGRRQMIDVEGLRLFVASAEDVIIAKLEWGKLSQSHRQVEDVAAILRTRWDLLDRVYLREWIDALALGQVWNDALSAAGIAESA